MSLLEVKDNLCKLIAEIEDEKTLLRLRDVVTSVMIDEQAEVDPWNDLSEDQRDQLRKAVQSIGDPSQWISHEQVKKKYDAWFTK